MDHLYALRELYAQGLTISDLAPLTYLVNLESLDLSGCSNLSDVGPLFRLRQLKYLSLAGCRQIKDLAPIVDLPKLEVLNITGCDPELEIPQSLSDKKTLHIFK
jgi:internalin A